MADAGGYQEYKFVAEYYDYVAPYRDRQDIAFFVDSALESGGPVLEVGSGTGRVLIPTARAGINIVGLDLSEHMLSVCRENLREEPVEVRERVELIQADMRQFDLKKSFPLVTLPFRPFQHLLTIEDQISCLKSINNHLDVEGHLILDLFNPSLEALTRDNIGEEFGDEPESSTPSGQRVIRRHKIVARDLFNQINHTELIYYVTHPDGRHERLVHAFPMRYLFRFEAEHLLVRCGFRLEHVYADYDKSPYGSDYPGELIMVARKE